MDRADLHTHSSFSDGADTPSRIVQIAEKKGLGGISLNDHDTIDGLEEFMSTLITRKMMRVPSLEISTHYGRRSAHLLGFYVPRRNQMLDLKLKWLREEREKRFVKMIDRVEEELGFIPSEEYLKGLLDGVDSPGRPHLGRILIDHGIVGDMDEAFEKYLYNDGPLYIKKVKLELQEAVELLRNVAAVPILAHPLDLKVDSIRTII
ncbi:MAG: PHP domain-containing protein, partial [Candidatus Thorarchaeota archaeon]